VLVKRIIRRLLRMVRRKPTSQLISIPQKGRALDGVDVLGFFTSEHGVGEAARALTSTLKSGSIAVSTIDYTDTQSRREHAYNCDNESQYKVLLASINSDQLSAAHTRIKPEFFDNRYVIGQWFWELEDAPAWFAPAYPLVNELWAPTHFIEGMLRANVPSSVHVEYVPLPVQIPVIDASLTRQRFGVDERFVFLFVFDFMSVMKRKNPLGLIEAFTSAFTEGEGPQLVIKGINGDKRPAEHAVLSEAVAQRSDISLIDEYFTRAETSTLISMANAYVSLHRSEGLGLTISEAMTLGVPVIATGYSGNMDFMRPGNSLLVPGTRVLVGEGAEGYPPTATWMEPDISQAARYMRYVYENEQEALEMGKCGQRDIVGSLTTERCGAIMKNRLDDIWSSLHGN
jgi:glycosyltransferase involved in cell wall biosynthesis